MPDLKIWSQKELSKLKSNLDRLFDDFCSDFALDAVRRKSGECAFFDDHERVVARIDIPEGMDVDSLKLQVTERSIIVQGRSEQLSANAVHRSTFHRELRLPCRIRPDDVKASFEKGRLEISLPKCGCPEVRTVQIERR